MYPDAGGVRDTFRSMADHLAGLGYAVALPDIYYRVGDYPPFAMDTVFTDPEERRRLSELTASLTPEMSARDAGAVLDTLAERPEVASGPVGTTGYCMGGRISLTVAGHHGERIGAAASIHGGQLARENDPNSPHLLAERVRAVVYVAGAHEDASFPPEQAERLDRAYTDASVQHTIETYPARHGFAVPDLPTYDAQAAARHWQALTDLFSATLRS